MSGLLTVKRNGEGSIYCHIRKKYLVETPEETTRQMFVCALVNEYGYKLEQMQEEENVTGRGSAQARADLLIYKKGLAWIS